MAGELLKTLAGIDVVHVPFKGIPEAMTAAMSGTILFNFRRWSTCCRSQ